MPQATARISAVTGELDAQRQISQRALSQVELLNQQISALRKQIAALEDALDVSEARDRQSNTKIADLGRRLNVALAQRVQELNRYRSDFFGRLREILSDRENIRIVGDRFVFQSEVLFPSGSDVINDAGKVEMKKLADAIIELQREIPPEINWVLRVDGHTDNIPVSGNRPLPRQLGAVVGARDVGGQVPDRKWRPGQAAGRCRVRRIPAARRSRHRRGANPQPAHRAEADRALIATQAEVRKNRHRRRPDGATCSLPPRRGTKNPPRRRVFK